MKKLYSLLACMATFTLQANAGDIPVGMELNAHEWCSKIVAGWNLGNALESAPSGWDANSTSIGWQEAFDASSETGWGNPATTKAMIDSVKAVGFNAVRIPVRWGCHITDINNMSISETWLKRVKEVVNYCIDNDMYVILNTHHDMWLEYQANPGFKDINNARLNKLWTNIANYFADYDGHLAFAGTNEVHIKDNWNQPVAANLAVQNSYLQTFIDAVRATGGKNYYRHLIIQTWACNPYFGTGGKLIIPNDVAEHGKTRMSVEFHYYNPYNYCSGNTGTGYYYYWGNAYKNQGYSTPSDNEATITTLFNTVKSEWYDKGLGIIIGEYGVSDHYTSAEKDKQHECMQYYLKTLVSEMRRFGYAGFVWDNNVFGNGSEKFGIFNRRANMAIKAPYIYKGIMDGAGIEYNPNIGTPTGGSTNTEYGKAATTLWEGEADLAWGDGFQYTISAGDFTDFEDEDKLVIYCRKKEMKDNYCMIQFFYGDWSANPSFFVNGTAASKEFLVTDFCDNEDNMIPEITFDTSTNALLKKKGLAIQGYGLTMTKIILVDTSKLGISSVIGDKRQSNICYDLLGRPVSDQTKGLIIRNGRKYIIK